MDSSIPINSYDGRPYDDYNNSSYGSTRNVPVPSGSSSAHRSNIKFEQSKSYKVIDPQFPIPFGSTNISEPLPQSSYTEQQRVSSASVKSAELYHNNESVYDRGLQKTGSVANPHFSNYRNVEGIYNKSEWQSPNNYAVKSTVPNPPPPMSNSYTQSPYPYPIPRSSVSFTSTKNICTKLPPSMGPSQAIHQDLSTSSAYYSNQSISPQQFSMMREKYNYVHDLQLKSGNVINTASAEKHDYFGRGPEGGNGFSWQYPSMDQKTSQRKDKAPREQMYTQVSNVDLSVTPKHSRNRITNNESQISTSRQGQLHYDDSKFRPAQSSGNYNYPAESFGECSSNLQHYKTIPKTYKSDCMIQENQFDWYKAQITNENAYNVIPPRKFVNQNEFESIRNPKVEPSSRPSCSNSNIRIPNKNVQNTIPSNANVRIPIRDDSMWQTKFNGKTESVRSVEAEPEYECKTKTVKQSQFNAVPRPIQGPAIAKSSTKPNYKKMINFVHSLRNTTSENDLNMQIIKKALNYDSTTNRMQENDLRKSIFDSPEGNKKTERHLPIKGHLEYSLPSPKQSTSANNFEDCQRSNRLPQYDVNISISNKCSHLMSNSVPTASSIECQRISKSAIIPLNGAPLDLSVKTVKTCADSTDCRERRHPNCLNNPYAVPKVDFMPDFTKHSLGEHTLKYFRPEPQSLQIIPPQVPQEIVLKRESPQTRPIIDNSLNTPNQVLSNWSEPLPATISYCDRKRSTPNLNLTPPTPIKQIRLEPDLVPTFKHQYANTPIEHRQNLVSVISYAKPVIGDSGQSANTERGSAAISGNIPIENSSQVIAARIRTKAELKGFTPSDVPAVSKPLNDNGSLAIASSPSNASLNLDLLTWNNTCNDLVEQLKDNDKKVRSKNSMKLNANSQQSVEKVEVKRVKEDVPENKSIGKMIVHNSSEEDRPLLFLRQKPQDSIPINGKIKQRSKNRIEQERRFVARHSKDSSSESDSETEKISEKRTRRFVRKHKTNKAEPNLKKENSGKEVKKSPKKEKLKSNFKVAVLEKTMTRSKRRRELELQLANSKVLRNDKVIEINTKKLPKRKVLKTKAISSEIPQDSYRSRLRNKKTLIHSKLKKRNNNKQQQKLKKAETSKRKSKAAIKPPLCSKNYPPGWELEVYQYKKSLKVPLSLITIKGPNSHRVSTSLPDLDAHSSDASEFFAAHQSECSELLDQEKGADNKLVSCIKEQPRSIIDVLHSRVLNSKPAPEKRSFSSKKIHAKVKTDNVTFLGSREEDDEEEVEQHHSVFDTKVYQSRTRTEYKLMKNKEIIREVFGCEDRPASAPPGIIQVKQECSTFESKYEEYVQKMLMDIEKRDRERNASSLSMLPKHIKKEENEDSSNAQENSISVLSQLEQDEADIPLKYLEKMVFKNRHTRRKFSSGFDYIRKKKKPPKIINRFYIDALKRRKNLMELHQKREEQDVSREIQKWVLNKSVGQSAMHKAARLGYIDVIAYCLERMGLNPDIKDNAGYTALHEACAKGRLDIARCLLQYGANHSETAHSGIRPLHEASENGHVEVVRLLLSFGADPLLTTYSGQTPLMLAEDDHVQKYLRKYLFEVQNLGTHKRPWYFKGPWAIYDVDSFGYDVLDGAPSDDDNFKFSSPPRERCKYSNRICQEENFSEPQLDRNLFMTNKCSVVLDSIDHFDTVKVYKDNHKRQQLLAASPNEVDHQFLVDGSDGEGCMFEFEEADMPLPPLYLFKEEGAEKWMLLSDLCNLLKVKSKDTLLKQISPNSTTNKDLTRELQISEFLEKSTCLQLLCSGEKLNIGATKVVLVKYNESVRNLLRVNTILMKF